MARYLVLAAFIAALSSSVVARRLQPRKTSSSKSIANGKDAAPEVVLDDLQLGDNPQGPLVPSLVPKPGRVFEVRNQKPHDFKNTQEYHWIMVDFKNTLNGTVNYMDNSHSSFAKCEPSFVNASNFHSKLLDGWKTTVVKNTLNVPLFKIRLTKHKWNPFKMSWSFRIVHPRTGKVLFTINKDRVGTGLLARRDEWRIYRGRKRARQQIYYVVSGSMDHAHYFYHTKADYKKGKKPVAETSDSVALDQAGLPDSYTLQVKEGEDTALLMAASVIFDMVEQQGGVQEEVPVPGI